MCVCGVRAYVCMCLSLSLSLCLCPSLLCMCVYVRLRTCVCDVCVRVSMCVCVYVCVCLLSLYLCICLLSLYLCSHSSLHSPVARTTHLQNVAACLRCHILACVTRLHTSVVPTLSVGTTPVSPPLNENKQQQQQTVSTSC